MKINDITRRYPFYKGRGWLVFQNKLKKHLELLPAEYCAPLYTGQNLYINPKDYIGSMVYFFRDLDPKISWFLHQILKEGDVFIDVGANCGTETIPAARAVGVTGKVYAFEPNQACVALMRRSLVENQISNVEIIQKGVSNVTGSAQLSIPSNNAGSAIVVNTPSGASMEIALTTLDSCGFLFEKRAKLMKIDIEGHEMAALEGATALFAENKPENVMIEIWRDPQKQFNDLKPVKFLKGHGYRPYQIDQKLSLWPCLRDLSAQNPENSSNDFLFTSKEVL
jgi:FkbM family methyltransferase